MYILEKIFDVYYYYISKQRSKYKAIVCCTYINIYIYIYIYISLSIAQHSIMFLKKNLKSCKLLLH